MNGCDENFELYGSNDNNASYTGLRSFKAYGGEMFLPICTQPEQFPILASSIFITFILVCGFILVSLTLAAVTLGINERIDEIKSEKEKEDKQVVPRQLGYANRSFSSSAQIDYDPAALVTTLQKHWHYQECSRSFRQSSLGIISTPEEVPQPRGKSIPATGRIYPEEGTGQGKPNADMENPDPLLKESAPRAPPRRSMLYNSTISNYSVTTTKRADSLDFTFMDKVKVTISVFTDTRAYTILVAVLILFSAVLELWALQIGARGYTIGLLQAIIQIFFIIDIALRFILRHPDYMHFFNSSLNRFDLAIVLLTCIPFLSFFITGSSGEYLGKEVLSYAHALCSFFVTRLCYGY